MAEAHDTATSTALATPGEALSAALAEPASAWPDVVLRPHQIEALDELAARLVHGSSRTWVDAPTGSGKTIMFCALAAALGGSALILVPRRNLAEQTLSGLARHFPSVQVQPEGPESAGRPGVTVCTYQAALRHQDNMSWESVDLLICDEAHATLGAQTRRLLDRAADAVVVGFTATGSTTTGHVEQVFGPVATTLDRQSAIERGILCPLRSLRVERAVDLSDVARVRGDFDQASLGRALDKALWHRACAEVWSEHFAPLGLAGVAYTATVAQAHALSDELCAKGARAAAVSGQTPQRDLARILMDFGAGRIDVLCNADLLTEGWDETRASVVMHLAPTTSERVFVQRLGRVMRPAPDKEAVSVEFIPAGDPMGVQTSHDVFGLGWYKPLGRVAGPPEGGERGKLAKAAALLAAQDDDGASLVNPTADPAVIAAGLADGGWRAADPGRLPPTLMEDWVEAAAQDVTADEIADTVTGGIDPSAGTAWWALSGLIARRAADTDDQGLWRAWAMAMITQPDLRLYLPDDVPRRVLDRSAHDPARAPAGTLVARGRRGPLGPAGDARATGALGGPAPAVVCAPGGVELGGGLGLGRVAHARRGRPPRPDPGGRPDRRLGGEPPDLERRRGGVDRPVVAGGRRAGPAPRGARRRRPAPPGTGRATHGHARPRRRAGPKRLSAPRRPSGGVGRGLGQAPRLSRHDRSDDPRRPAGAPGRRRGHAPEGPSERSRLERASRAAAPPSGAGGGRGGRLPPRSPRRRGHTPPPPQAATPHRRRRDRGDDDRARRGHAAAARRRTGCRRRPRTGRPPAGAAGAAGARGSVPPGGGRRPGRGGPATTGRAVSEDADPRQADRATRTADDAWARVRRLADRAAAEAVDGEDVHPDRVARHGRAVVRAERALQRALLADQMADALADVRRRRDARVEGHPPKP